jgi:hypothetical protein
MHVPRLLPRLCLCPDGCMLSNFACMTVCLPCCLPNFDGLLRPCAALSGLAT